MEGDAYQLRGMVSNLLNLVFSGSRRLCTLVIRPSSALCLHSYQSIFTSYFNFKLSIGIKTAKLSRNFTMKNISPNPLRVRLFTAPLYDNLNLLCW